MGEVLEHLGAGVTSDGVATLDATLVVASRPRTSSSARCERPSWCSDRSWRASVTPASRCRGATTSVRVHRPPHAGLEQMGRRSSPRTGSLGGAGAPRCVDHAGLPQRGRHREPPDGGRRCAGHHGDRQRRARAGDRRPRGVPRRDGGACRRRGLDDDRGRRASAASRPAEHAVISDRIEAGTYAAAAVATCGDVHARGRATRPPGPVARQARRGGRRRSRSPTTASGCARRSRRRPSTSSPFPYPGLATDFQPILIAALSIADGTSHRDRERLREPVPLRADELRRMGADMHRKATTP